MSEEEKKVAEEVESNENENPEEVEEKEEPAEGEKESFLSKISKPVKPLFAWLIFGGAVVVIVLIGIIVLTNIK